jgi:hypothetical protein
MEWQEVGVTLIRDQEPGIATEFMTSIGSKNRARKLTEPP